MSLSLDTLRALLDHKASELESRREALAAELEAIEAEIGSDGAAPKRGPGRPRGKRGPGRPPKNGRRRGPGRPPNARKRRGPGRPPKKVSKKGGRRRGPRAGVRGPRGDEGVQHYIRKVLAKANGPMRLADLAKAVVAAGYKTTSPRFGVIVGQRLAEMKDVKKPARGVYAMNR